MKFEYYMSFGNMSYKIISDEEIKSTEPFSDFLYSECRYDFLIVCHISDTQIVLPEEKCVLSRNNRVYFQNGNIRDVYYASTEPNTYYAHRRFDILNNKIDITFSPDAKDKIRFRLVLNTFGIEDCAIQKSSVVFHASFIDYFGRGVLFTGKSGVGKSTQADLWNKYKNTEIINGDKAILCFDKENAYVSGLPFSGSSGISENKSLRLFAVVSLEQSKINEAAALTPMGIFRTLINSSYFTPIDTERVSFILENIAKKIKACRLKCTPDIAACDTLQKFLEEGTE